EDKKTIISNKVKQYGFVGADYVDISGESFFGGPNISDADYFQAAAKGETVLAMNFAAVDRGVDGLVEIPVPAAWAGAEELPAPVRGELPDYVRSVLLPVNALRGDSLPVSV
ncbi:MAG: hypothetical protein RR197_02330, partial [Oscillospiraceae bacterium]